MKEIEQSIKYMLKKEKHPRKKEEGNCKKKQKRLEKYRKMRLQCNTISMKYVTKVIDI